MWMSCIVLRACNSASKYAFYCVLEWLALWTINISHLTHTETRTQARTVCRTKQPPFLHRPARSSRPLSLTPQRHAAPSLLWPLWTLFQFLHEMSAPRLSGPFIVAVSRLYSDTPHSVCLLWTGVQQVPGTSVAEVLNRESFAPSAGFEHAQCQQVKSSRPTP